MDINTGQDLINLIEASQQTNFAKFYTQFFKKLLLQSDKYVNDVNVAEEIVQDVFLKMWENPQQLQEVSFIKAYLYKAVINASINHLNRQKNIVLHHSKIAANFTEAYFIDIDEENELIVLLHVEIDKLPAKCKRVFKLSRFDKMKYKEIAALLNISDKTVENHIQNALKLLKEAFLNNKKVSGKNYQFLMLYYLS